MARKGRARLRKLAELVAEAHPELDAVDAITAARVAVDGWLRTNPASLVREDAAITLRRDDADALRGERKLRAALAAFDVRIFGRVALDLGAAAGGFTRVLLEAGAARVYAVDAGFGQLLGSLRQDARVVNLERTNVGALNRELVHDVVDVVTADLSYIALANAVPQLEGRVLIASNADLVALVKPQFELGLREPPSDSRRLADAAAAARSGVERAGWNVAGIVESPVRGARGATEFLLHATRSRGMRAPEA